MIHNETIETYDKSAAGLAEYFAGVGPRIEAIEKGLELAGCKSGQARVVETGCGDGRDAVDIVPRVAWYEGFDPAEGFIRLARARTIPNANFVVADALSYAYPAGLDVVYAFASFLHLDRDDFAAACKRVYGALRKGGILLITLKEHDTYKEKLVTDEFGERMFYYYNEEIVRELAGDGFEQCFVGRMQRGATHWLCTALRKKSNG